MKVKVTIKNMYEYIDIRLDSDKNKLVVNGTRVDKDVREFLSKLQTIVASWPLTMVDDSIIDGEEYSVTMVLGDKVREYIGRNSYPLNYGEFKTLIKDYV